MSIVMDTWSEWVK